MENEHVHSSIFRCHSIYMAAYLMCKYNRKLMGTDVDSKKVTFLFYADGNEKKAMDEFKGIGSPENSQVDIYTYMNFVNHLKDVAKQMTKDQPSYTRKNF